MFLRIDGVCMFQSNIFLDYMSYFLKLRIVKKLYLGLLHEFCHEIKLLQTLLVIETGNTV